MLHLSRVRHIGNMRFGLDEVYFLLQCQDRLAHLQQRRTRPPAAHLRHGVVDQPGQLSRPLGLALPLDQGREPVRIGRTGIVAVQVRSRNDQDGRRHVVGRRKSRRGVEEPRALHDDHPRGLARRPEVAVGHVGRGLLVAHGDVVDLVRLPQRVDYLVLPRARYAEHGTDALALQRPHEGLASRHPGQCATCPGVVPRIISPRPAAWARRSLIRLTLPGCQPTIRLPASWESRAGGPSMVEALELKPQPDLASRVKGIEEDGYAFFPGAMSPDQVAELREVMKHLTPIEASFNRYTTPDNGGFLNKHINNVFNRDPIFLQYMDKCGCDRPCRGHTRRRLPHYRHDGLGDRARDGPTSTSTATGSPSSFPKTCSPTPASRCPYSSRRPTTT